MEDVLAHPGNEVVPQRREEDVWNALRCPLRGEINVKDMEIIPNTQTEERKITEREAEGDASNDIPMHELAVGSTV